MLILPAIDLIAGKCVRLKQGDYAQQTDYGSDPVEVAKSFADQGAEYIHVVDLDAAKSGKPENVGTIERICASVQAKVEVGGGVRSLETARFLIGLGVARVIVGTKLVQDQSLAEGLFQELGEQVVAGLDMRDGKVALHGWTAQSDIDALDLARDLERKGCRRFIVTDIATDGMLQGPNLPMLTQFARELAVPVIASGGVSTLDDLRAIADIPKIEGAIVGKALYEGRFTVADAVALG